MAPRKAAIERLMLRLARLRHAIATALGHESYAHYSQAGLALGGPEQVAAVLHAAAEAARPAVEQQVGSREREVHGWSWSAAVGTRECMAPSN